MINAYQQETTEIWSLSFTFCLSSFFMSPPPLPHQSPVPQIYHLHLFSSLCIKLSDGVYSLNSENRMNTVSPGRGLSFPSAAAALASCISFSKPLTAFRALSISKGPQASWAWGGEKNSGLEVAVIHKVKCCSDGPRKCENKSVVLGKEEKYHSQTNTHLYSHYLLSSCAEFSQRTGQIFGTLTELHGRGLVANSGHCSLGCGHHLGSRLKVRKTDTMSQDVRLRTHFDKIRTGSWRKRLSSAKNLKEVLAGSD